MSSMRAELENAKNLSDASVLIGGPAVVAVRDYQKSVKYEFTADGVKTSPITLPKSNVLLYELGGDKGIDWACARPSGTEPKLKIYFGIYDKDRGTAEARLGQVCDQMSTFVKGKLGI